MATWSRSAPISPADPYGFDLPPELIAQTPARPREAARLLAVGETLADHIVADLPHLLAPGDLLVANDTRVIPAQLAAHRGAARIGLTLDRPLADGAWHALARNARRVAPGDVLSLDGTEMRAAVVTREEGSVTLRFDREGEPFAAALREAGALALPPYIARPSGPTPADAADYQTVFARTEGAVAAPTGGLHFTPALLAALDAAGIARATVTLHVGAGTFLPVRGDPAQHRMHPERGTVTEESAAAIRQAARVVAVGTTTLRLLESAATEDGVQPFDGDTSLFIQPGFRFRAVHRLMTNFHLPHSTLFMLVCAFAGTERMRAAYAHAIAHGYRFYSYGIPVCWTSRREHAKAPSPPSALVADTPIVTLSWTFSATDGAARTGILHTAHGDVPTPVFMPVGTAGTVKAMTADAVRITGAKLVLGNTYHLMLRPGAERVAALGGLHRFMDWPGPILTDSGGFQVMSLAGLRKMDEGGVTFRSHLDGTAHRLTPETSTAIQDQLDATITMAFDECTPFPATEQQARTSMELSMRWAARSRAAFRARLGYGQFGIVQGGVFPELRARSVADLIPLGFEGYAIGGLAVGEGQDAMFAVLDATTPQLPADKPRYLMGVGTPDDLLGGVARGVDMFDCVMPTRAGRTARAYTSRGVLNLRNARHAADAGPLDPACRCLACTRHSRAYLHHLFRAGEMLGPMLLTAHNLTYYADLMAGMRDAITAGRLDAHAAGVRAGWADGGGVRP